jgi:AraC-like DNA-binding protein
MTEKQQWTWGYTDDGCDVHPKCLECPLIICKYDDIKPYLAWKKRRQENRMRVVIDTATTMKEAAQILGITERHAYRIKNGHQRAPSFKTAKRIQEVAREIANGDSLRTIADKHGLAERTIARYRLKLERGDYDYGPNV